MFFAYVDESGDEGLTGSRTYTLGCILVAAESWPATFDDLISFRRFLRDRFRVPVRGELKANHLVRNAGIFRHLGLGDRIRHDIYRQAMRLQPKLDFRTFAIMIRKPELFAKDPQRSPREVAWEYLIQRLERFSTKGQTTVMVIHDQGEANLVRKLVRKARRAGSAGSAFGTGSIKVPARLLLDDPVPRDSAQSYFLQLADLTAYAAYRRWYPPPPRVDQVVPGYMWDELGKARYERVNALSGGVPGIVDWPHMKGEPPGGVAGG